MKKWFKRLLIVGFVLSLLCVVGAWIEWQYTARAGRQRLMKIQSALDASEPGWRIHELNDRRNASLPPDERNVAVAILNVIDQIPMEFFEWERRIPEDLRANVAMNHMADQREVTEARRRFEPLKPLIAPLHQTRQFMTGGNRIVFAEPNLMDTLLNDTQNLRKASDVVSWHVFFACLDNDPNAAIEGCRTNAHVRHAIGDEPLLISQLVRIALIAISINNSERTLAMTVPIAGLAELQADYERALTEADFLRGIEGERAIINRLMENLNGGQLTPTQLASSDSRNIQGQTPGSTAGLYFHRYGRDSQAKILEIMTAYRDATLMKGKDRMAEYRAIQKMTLRSFSNLYVHLFCYYSERIIEANLRIEAHLSAIIAAIACERYRQAIGKWPESLNDIPKEILKEIPLDPYVGGPLKYRKNEWGVVIYSTGLDEIDHGGVTLDLLGIKPQSDSGIQLYDLAKRRLPAEKKADEPFDGPPPLPKSDTDPIPESKPQGKKN